MSWFWSFTAYSFLGFLLEVAFAAAVGGRPDRKGLLVLPLCPVYGLGAGLILLLPGWVDARPWLLFLLDGLTVRQNILLPAIIGGTVSDLVESRADQLCEVFGIPGIRDKYPAEISGGEKQRTAVARALINHPLLILADEPTGNLDSKSTRAVIRSFEQAKTALEATIFMVTHDSYAASFCDRVIILRDGVVWKTLEKGGTDREKFQDELLDAIREMGRAE